GASEPFFEAERGERRADVVVDLHLVARAVEAAQPAALLVVVYQRLGLLVVGREPLLHLLRRVVLALLERLAVPIAAACVLVRVYVDVVQVPCRALAAPGEALDDGLVRRVDQQRGGQPPVALLELL